MIDRTKRVYFARCIGPTGEPIGAYKIGCSHGWNERVKQVASNLPFTLEVEATVQGGYVMEKVIHILLKHEKISGEYFHARGDVVSFVQTCAERGSPFWYISDVGGSDTLPDGALHAFMRYHGVTLAEACRELGVSLSSMESRAAKKSYSASKIIAAVAIVAAHRQQYVNWPTDALLGLLGKKSPRLRDDDESNADSTDQLGTPSKPTTKAKVRQSA